MSRWSTPPQPRAVRRSWCWRRPGSASAGGSPSAVMAAASAVAARVRLLGMVPHLEHLVRSGRVPGLAGWAGRALGINPLFELRDGRVKRLRPAIGSEAAVDRMVARFRRSGVPDARGARLCAARGRARCRSRVVGTDRERGRRGRGFRQRVRAGHGRPHRTRAPRSRVVVGNLNTGRSGESGYPDSPAS